MSKLTSKARKSLPASDFGEPGARKFPMPDKSHARNALARLAEQVNEGRMSSGEAAKVKAKAKRKLGTKA